MTQRPRQAIKLWFGTRKGNQGPIEAELIEDHKTYPRVAITDPSWLKRLGLTSFETRAHKYYGNRNHKAPEDGYAWLAEYE